MVYDELEKLMNSSRKKAQKEAERLYPPIITSDGYVEWEPGKVKKRLMEVVLPQVESSVLLFLRKRSDNELGALSIDKRGLVRRLAQQVLQERKK